MCFLCYMFLIQILLLFLIPNKYPTSDSCMFQLASIKDPFCKAPYTINFIVNYSTLYKVIDRVWAVLMQLKILYKTIDINYIASIKLRVYGPLNMTFWLHSSVDGQHKLISKFLLCWFCCAFGWLCIISYCCKGYVGIPEYWYLVC